MHLKNALQLSWLLLAALMFSSAGCGDPAVDGRPPTYFTSGQVLLDGEPVPEATVVFQPVDQPDGKPGFALTDAEGYFEAQTFEPGDGLTAGTHRVSIRKSQIVDKKTGEVVEVVGEPGLVKEVELVPKTYGNFKTSGLEARIKAEEENELPPFELSTPSGG